MLGLAAPVLLVHPPNSSSAVTFGAGLNPPPVPGIIGVSANEVLQPKSAAGDLACSAGFTGAAGATIVDDAVTGADTGAGAGAGEDHSLEPHTSTPERADPKLADAAAGTGGSGLVCGADRLKTEVVEAGGEITRGGGGGELCDTGAERSNRSPMADDADWEGLGGGAVAVCVGGGEEKDGNPSNPEFDGFC